MQKPVLVIMAAGMGSRYGGLKQIDPVDPEGHIIMDFSVYDAYQAGFRKVIFIIKEENLQLFKASIGDRVAQTMEVEYIFQKLDDLPEGYQVPEGRTRPWGTGQAVLSCADVIDGPFAVINADDYYGSSAFHKIYAYLTTHTDDELYRYTMVGYQLKNTVTRHGTVSRGICRVDEDHFLTDIVETHGLGMDGDKIVCRKGDGICEMDPDTVVSMNLWGFSASILPELKSRFEVFCKETVPENPMKAEYYLPFVVNELIQEKCATAEVLVSEDKWYGVTYQEDKPVVVAALGALKEQGKYQF